MRAEKERREKMGVFVNPGNEAFAVALNSEIYVDKTELLTYTNKVMNTLQGYICNSRPRRFGKSITPLRRPSLLLWAESTASMARTILQ